MLYPADYTLKDYTLQRKISEISKIIIIESVTSLGKIIENFDLNIDFLYFLYLL